MLHAALSDEELARRRAAWHAPPLSADHGLLLKYAYTVSSASEGCVTDAIPHPAAHGMPA